MPTKRRRVARGRIISALTLEQLDIALGYQRTNEEIATLAADGIEYDNFAEFDYGQADIDRLWREHAPAILAEWRRRGCPPCQRAAAAQG